MHLRRFRSNLHRKCVCDRLKYTKYSCTVTPFCDTNFCKIALADLGSAALVLMRSLVSTGLFRMGDHDMKTLEERLGYQFKNRALLENALTHSSYANEHRDSGLTSNERLEFLGDSVLGMVVADHLFREHPNMPEGELTRTRAALVCEGSLFEVARALGLGKYLRLGKGEDAGGGRERPSILADATEAVFAAVYLDGGIAPARRLIRTLILGNEEEMSASRDYKTALQELVQKESGQKLTYCLIGEEGPDHAKRFSVAVELNGKTIGTGEGRTKKAAEQSAAKAAIEKLK